MKNVTVVPDAGVVFWALTDLGPRGEAARARLGGEDLVAPEHIDVEVANTVRRRVAAGLLNAAVAEAALRRLEGFAMDRMPPRILLRQTWALRHNLTMYDASYAAFAAGLKAPLLTTDRRLAAAPGLPCEVEVLG